MEALAEKGIIEIVLMKAWKQSRLECLLVSFACSMFDELELENVLDIFLLLG